MAHIHIGFDINSGSSQDKICQGILSIFGAKIIGVDRALGYGPVQAIQASVGDDILMNVVTALRDAGLDKVWLYEEDELEYEY